MGNKTAKTAGSISPSDLCIPVNLNLTKPVTQENHKTLSMHRFFSIIPFLIFGALSNWLVEISLGGSWAISTGILACMACGVYELGRRDAENS